MRHSEKSTVLMPAIPANKRFLALLVFFIVPISGLSVDIYVPSMPAMSQYFNVDKSLVQLTITFYMIGLGVMQFFAGSISDSFGRRKPFLMATFIFIVTTLLIPFVQNIAQLLCCRLIQGITVAVMVVPMRSVISDLFEGTTYYKMINYMTLAWSIGPIIAPAIGGYMQDYFGWKANFYLLAIYTTLSLIFNVLFLPETSIHRHPFHVTKILKRYKEILVNKDYLIGLAINGLLYSIIIIFTIVGPFYIQTVLHYSAIQFGYIALLTGVSWFIGGVINRFVIHIPLQIKVRVCFLAMFAISVALLLTEIVFQIGIYFVLPLTIITMLGNIVFPSYFGQAMALFPKSSGSANALLGAFLYVITGISSGLATFLEATSTIPLATAYVFIMGLCLTIVYFGYRKKAVLA